MPSLKDKCMDSSIRQFDGGGEPGGPGADNQDICPFHMVVHVAPSVLGTY
jgi:hypothetical protein